MVVDVLPETTEVRWKGCDVLQVLKELSTPNPVPHDNIFQELKGNAGHSQMEGN